MGREWLWSSSSTSSSLAKGDCKESSNAAPPGCMSGVLHCLHFHPSLFNSDSRSPPPASSSPLSPVPLPPPVDLAHHEQLRGFETPRNSLELDEGIKPVSLSMEDEFYDVHVSMEISSAESKQSSQQQVETPRSAPGIVARLMGLEISPDHASSPTPKMTPPPQQQQLRVLRSKKKSWKSFDGDSRCCAMGEHDSPSPREPLRSLDRNAAAADGEGFRSLPETPRVSSAAAAAAPRRSCEINKENYVTTTGERRPLPPPPSAYTAVKTEKRDSEKHQDENKSPRSRHNPLEIVEQMKETITSRRGDGGRPDEIKFKSKRTRKTTMAVPPLRSPLQLRKADTATKNASETSKMVLNKCKKADNKRFTERIIKRQQKRAPTTLASLFLSADMLSTNENRSRPTSSANLPSTRRSTPTLGAATQRSSDQNRGPEFRYIKSIFERAGIAGVRSLRRSSPLLPVDPIVFEELELELPLFTGYLRSGWNRKLMFHLVEEILGDILLSCSEYLSPSSAPTTVGDTDEEALLRRVWGQIESFSAEGNVDVRALISRDLPENNVRRLLRHPSVVEEAEDMASEVEQEILAGLVSETAASLTLSTSLSAAAGVNPRRNLSRHC